MTVIKPATTVIMSNAKCESHNYYLPNSYQCQITTTVLTWETGNKYDAVILV